MLLKYSINPMLNDHQVMLVQCLGPGKEQSASLACGLGSLPLFNSHCTFLRLKMGVIWCCKLQIIKQGGDQYAAICCAQSYQSTHWITSLGQSVSGCVGRKTSEQSKHLKNKATNVKHLRVAADFFPEQSNNFHNHKEIFNFVCLSHPVFCCEH